MACVGIKLVSKIIPPPFADRSNPVVVVGVYPTPRYIAVSEIF
jgi:hypothetical protein